MKQLKIIDKSKKEDLQSETYKDLAKDLERLQRYADNYLAKKLKSNKFSDNNLSSASSNDSSKSEENDGIDDSQSLAQPEVESIMPSVSLFFYILIFFFN